LASQQTPGAFAFGLRLLALDSTVEDVADTPANAAFFGRLTPGKTASAYRQARCLYVAEVGTHAIVDAILAPCQASERTLAKGVLRSVTSDMLVLLDRGLFASWLVAAIGAGGGHVLARLEANWFSTPSQVLADGSYLVHLPAGSQTGLKQPLTLRIIEYRLDPALADELSQLAHSPTARCSDPRQVHPLVTTLLDPQHAPALDLICLYHERWEIESSIDEMKTHQRLASHPLRSKFPTGVLQELYGMLLAHYAVRAFMAASAQEAQLDPDRLSFTHAIHVLHDAARIAPFIPSTHKLRFWHFVLAELRQPSSLLPPRRLRFNRRVIKRLPTAFRRRRPTDKGLHLKRRSFSDLLLIY
jgi:hypothetical protein